MDDGIPRGAIADAEWAGLTADEAIPRLFEKHSSRLWAIGLRLCGDPTEAEDLVQDVFLQAWRSWSNYRGDSKPTTWLWTIATRVCSRRHRVRSGEPRRHLSLSEPDGVRDVPDQGATVDLSRREARSRIEKALPGVAEPFRMPLILKDLAGFSLEEIAGIVDAPVATIKTRIHRGRLQLREAIEGLESTHGVGGGSAQNAGQICQDLLEAKQEALDRGVPFPLPREELCEQCRIVFAALDRNLELCGILGEGLEVPSSLRTKIVSEIGAAR